MFTIAIIGSDGAGKSTLIDGLRKQLNMPVKYIYMGVNPEAMNVMLPTTRLLELIKRSLNRSEADAARRRATPAQSNSSKSSENLLKRLLKFGKSFFFTLNRIAEQWYRIAVAWIYLQQGNLVLFDRHFFIDYRVETYAQTNKPSFFRRILNWQLEHIYPRPSATLYLDAPAEILFARKGEGTIESLQQKRIAFQTLQTDVPNFIMLDATQTTEMVLQQALQNINTLYSQHQSASNQANA
jgi:thymidylate kinase